MPKYQLTLTEKQARIVRNTNSRLPKNKLASSEMRASFMNAYTQGNGMQ